MPISTTCPECSRKLRVPDELIGKRVKCPNCGQNFTAADEEAPQTAAAKVSTRRAPPPPPAPESDYEEVPDDEPPPPPPDDSDQDYDDEPARKKKKKKRRRSSDSDYLAPHRGQLIMILGICSMPAVFFGGITALILGIVTLVLANNDLREMREGRMDPAGEGDTNTGRICAIIGTILGAIPAVLIIGYLLIWVCCFGMILSGALGGAAGAGGGPGGGF